MRKRINVTKPSIPPIDEYCREIKSAWDTGLLTNFGPLERKLRGQLEEFLGVRHLPLFANGHQALMAAIKAFALPGRTSVITTPFTFASTTEAIAGLGLKPVFCDVDPVTYTLDPAKVEALIDDDTAAIVPVHVYGNVCDTESFDRISGKYNIPVIYDAAHCFGVTKNAKGIGTFGAASMFSFHATKAFNTVEGGAVAVSDPETADRIKRYSSYGLIGTEDADVLGTNAKMTEFSAAMGICNLRHIGEVTEKRKNICEIYTRRLTEGADFDEKTGLCASGIKLLPKQEGVEKNYAYFPVVFDGYKYNRDEIAQKLADNNIFARKYFYPITNTYKAYEGAFTIQKTPIAKHIGDCVLTLPLYADISIDTVDRICDLIVE